MSAAEDDPTIAALSAKADEGTGDPTLDALASRANGADIKAPRSTISKVQGVAKGTLEAGAYQTLQQASGPTSILDPETWRNAYHSVQNLPHTLDRAAAGAAQWIADPARAWHEKVAEPASHMTPEQLGANYGPAAFQAASVLLPAAYGGLRALGAASDIEALPKGTLFGGRAPATEAAAGARSVGAAESAPLAQFETASPPLKAAAQDVIAKGGAINPVAAERHLQADSLPVPVHLSEGQATGEPATISNELNSRAKNQSYATFFNNQNTELRANLDALRDRIGPDVSTTNPVEHADTIIQAYKEKDAPRVAEIDSAYQALRDANGGTFPIDGQKFAENARAALKKQMRSYDLPANIERNLADLESGEPMDFESFEAMRSRLADEMRKAARAGDGSASNALGIVRGELEKLPLTGGAADLKPLADKARSLAKARFDDLRADPAYDAAVNETVPPDKFVSKFVTGGNRDKVALMRANLADNERATQTMGVAALDELRTAARIDSKGEGNFAAAGFARRLSALEPKLQHLVGPENVGTLHDLADVAGYTLHQPRGSWVNNSNSWVSAASELADTIANLKTGGAWGWAKSKVISPALDARKARQSLSTGAGLGNPAISAPPETPK